MKRSIIVSLLLMILSLFTFTACAQKPSYTGEFTQEEFVLSLDPETEIDFFENLTLQGVKKEDISLSIIGDIAEQTDYGFKMIKPGRGLLIAQKDKKTFASASIVVKDKFNAPKNFTLNDDGTLVWDKVYTIFDGEVVEASGYIVKVDGEELPVRSNNSYKFNSFGTYNIQVKAVGTRYVGDSDFSVIQQQRFGVLNEVSDISIETTEVLSTGNIKLTWNSIPNCNYDIVVGGIEVYKGISSNYAIINFDNFHGGKEVNVSIIANDNSQMYFSSKTNFVITKLYDLTPEYVFDNGEGYVRWKELAGALGYVLEYTKLTGTITSGLIDNSTFFKKDGYVYSRLEGLGYGIYDIKVQAKGGKENNRLYADSKTALIEKVAKLEAPNFNYSFNDTQLLLQIADDTYVKKYDLSINGNKSVVDCSSSRVYRHSLSSLGVGLVNIELIAKPTFSGKVESITIDGVSTNKVVGSNISKDSIYVLEELGDITHSLVGDSSQLVFENKDRNIDTYTVTVNGITVTNAIVTPTLTTVKIEIPKLSTYNPIGNKYTFKVIGSRSKGDAKAVENSMTITILEAPKKALSQENGYFKWTSVASDNVEYVYTIYSSDKDQFLGEEVQAGTVTELKNKTALPFGYYIIKVEPKSTDTGVYLDNDFGGKLEDNYLYEFFHVEQAIDSPQLSLGYDETESVYTLTISKVEFAGKYEVSLDGTLLSDGTLIPTDLTKDSYVYKFTSTNFEDDNENKRQYVVSVVAKVSTEDQTLHPDSSASVLNVIRLEQPTFTVDEDEILSIVLPEGADYIVIKKDGQVLNAEKELVIDLKQFAGLNEISFGYIAQERQENNVYLDSAEKVYSFQRLNVPANLAFDSGKLTYTCASHEQTAEYKIKITLVNEANGNVEYVQTSSQLEFALNDFIEQMRVEDSIFTNAYAQCSSVEVSVMANRNSFLSSVYYLPSDYSNSLKLTKLTSTTISFNEDTQTLSWEAVGDVGMTYYSIFVDGTPIEENLTALTYTFSETDFSTAKEIVVYADNGAYLASAGSNVIVVRKLNEISTFYIALTQDKMSGNIQSQDLSKIQKVLVNGVEFTPSLAGEIVLNFADYKDVDYAFTIQLIARNKEEVADKTYYYISSDISRFKFYDLGEEVAVVEKSNDGLSINWTELGTLFEGNTTEPLSYNIVIKDMSGAQITIVEGLTENAIELDSETLFNLAENQYTFELRAVLADYFINSSEVDAVGYFGSKNLGSVIVKKIKQMPSDYFYSVVDSTSTDEIVKRIDGDVQIVWEDIWNDATGTLFDLVLETGTLVDNFFVNLKDGSSTNLFGYKFSLALVDGEYVFTMNKQLASLVFTDGVTTLPIQVHSSGHISSNIYNLRLERLASGYDISLSADGQLTIESVSGANEYIINLTMGGTTETIKVGDVSQPVDLMTDYIKQKTGSYTIKVLANDTSNNALPALEATEITGYRLQGVESVTVENTGRITIIIADEDKVYDDFVFKAKYKGKIYEFVPTYNSEDESYIYSTVDFIALFGEDIITDGELDISLFIVREDCVNSVEKEFSFIYQFESQDTLVHKREIELVDEELVANMSKDYLVIFDKIDVTTGLFIEVHYLEGTEELEDGEEPIEPNIKVVQIPVSTISLKGFWVVNEDGSEYFSKGEPASYYECKPCFALLVNDVLLDFDAGEYDFYVSRICDENGNITQYGQSLLSFKKLETIEYNTAKLSNGRISWRGIDSSDISGYYLTIYTRTGEYYAQVSQHEINETTTFDLTQVIKSSGTTYYLTISSISATPGYIASDETIKFVIGRYAVPQELIVEEGVLQYDYTMYASKFQLLKDIENNIESYTQMASVLASKEYTYPFQFTANNIAKATIRLQFTELTESGGEGKIYNTLVPAVDLISKYLKSMTFVSGSGRVNYYDALLRCRASVVGSPYYSTINNLVSSIEKSSFGIANSVTLFDEYGEAIPAGNYRLAIRQEGSAFETVNYQGMLPSNYSEVTIVSVTGTPSLKINREDEGDKYIYYLSFKPITVASLEDDVITYTDAISYKMNLRTEADVITEYSIKKLGDTWKLIYEDDQTFDLIENKYSGYVTIDLTNQFAKKVGLDGKSNLRYVSIYAEGNTLAINSKVDVVNMRILEFDYTSLKLEEGVVSWTADKNSNGTLITYCLDYASPKKMTINKSNSVLNLPDEGHYEYVMFMSLGEINVEGNLITVDSQSYRLNNVFKRLKPKVSVSNGLFLLSPDGKESSDYVNYSQFNISNNLSNKDYATTQVEEQGKTIEYIAGNYNGFEADSADYNYRMTELDATSFNFYSAGNSIVPEDNSSNHFTATQSEEGSDYDFMLNIINNAGISNVVLKSSSEIVPAKMLKAINPLTARVEKGDLYWNDAYTEEEEVQLAEDYILVYKVTVYHYASPTTKSPEYVDTFYTTQNKFSSSNIVVRTGAKYYSISVTTYAYARTTSDAEGSFATIEGDYIRSAEAKFNDNETRALASTEIILGGQKIVKADPIVNAVIKDDLIRITYEIQYKEIENLTAEVFRGLRSFKVLDKNGKEIEGTFEVEDDIALSEDGFTYSVYINYSLASSLIYENNPYQFKVYAFSTNDGFITSGETVELMSDGVDVVLSTNDTVPVNVYKLKAVNKSDLTFTYNVNAKTDNQYQINFEKYFNNYKILQDSGYAKIQILLDNNVMYEVTNKDPMLLIKVSSTEGMIETNAEGKQILHIKESTTLSFKAVKAVEMTGSNTIFASEKTSISFAPSNFGLTDSMAWEDKTFAWTSSKYVINQDDVVAYEITNNNGGLTIVETHIVLSKDTEIILLDEQVEYMEITYQKILYNNQILFVDLSTIDTLENFKGREFLVKIDYEDGTSETSNLITAENVDGLYYQPRKAGTITQASVYVRDGSFSLFSAPIILVGPFDFDIFASGSGTQEDPYMIATAEHFKNMALRNKASQKYYFELADDITIDIESPIIEDSFYGNLNGNGYTIYVTYSAYKTGISSLKLTLPSGSNTEDYEMRMGASLFTSLASSATIDNLNLSVNIAISNIYGGNTAITPLAFVNYGTISNVNITEFNTDISFGVDTGLLVAVAGLVGDNYGLIDNCTNSAVIDLYVNTNGTYIPYILYSGIALKCTNPSSTIGLIRNCFSTGSITLTARKNNTRLWVSGIVANLISNGAVINCGNDAPITLQGKGANSYSSYVSGIALRVSRASIQYAYNNASITMVDGASTLAGIAYTLQNSTVTGLVDTSALKLAYSCASTSGTNCYATVATEGLTINELAEVSITASNGYTLSISLAEGKYKAQISK